MYSIPKQVWYLQANDGLIHLLELNFKSRLKNVELKLDEVLLFDLKLKGYETVYPLRMGNQMYTLYLRKKPVGGYDCELKDEKEKNLPCLIDRPKNFGKPKRHWNKIVTIVGYLIAFAWVTLIIVLTIRIFIVH